MLTKLPTTLPAKLREMNHPIPVSHSATSTVTRYFVDNPDAPAEDGLIEDAIGAWEQEGWRVQQVVLACTEQCGNVTLPVAWLVVFVAP